MIFAYGTGQANPRQQNGVSSIASNSFAIPANGLTVVGVACTNGAVAASSMSTNIGNDGTYQGTVTLGQTGIPGSSATAVLFGPGYVTTNQSYSNPLAPLSLECWFKSTSSAGGGLVGFSAPQTGTSGSSWDRLLYLGSDGKLYFGIYTGSEVYITSTSTYNDGNWHHVVGVLAANNNMSLYVDGSLVASNSNTSNPQNYTGWWRIGQTVFGANNWPNSGSSSTNQMNGTIAHAAVYTAALSSSTISNHYSAGSTSGTTYDATVTGTAGLQNYWKLGDASGTTAVNTTNQTLSPTLLGKETANGGDAELWTFYSPLAQSGVVVTATFPSSQNLSIFTLVLTGANASQSGNATSGTTSASGTPSGTVTTTAAASYVLSAVANLTNTTSPSPIPGQAFSWNGISQGTNDGSHCSFLQTAGGQGNSGQAVTVKDSAPTGIAYAMITAEILSVASPAFIAGNSAAYTPIPTHPYLTQKASPKAIDLVLPPASGRIPGIV